MSVCSTLDFRQYDCLMLVQNVQNGALDLTLFGLEPKPDVYCQCLPYWSLFYISKTALNIP